jgi:hypothetical protein
MLGQGLTYKQIARERGCSVSTVRTHMHNMCAKLGVVNANQAIAIAYQRGWFAADNGGTLPAIRELTAFYAALEAAVRERQEHKLNASQRAYLDAFDEHLRARTPEDHEVTRAAMDQALTRVLDKANVPKPTRLRNHAHDGLARLLATLGGS